MGMMIEDIKHCLKAMVECEVCEECNLYGTTGTDHCECDCVYGALDIIDKYQKIGDIVRDYYNEQYTDKIDIEIIEMISEVLCDGNDD